MRGRCPGSSSTSAPGVATAAKKGNHANAESAAAVLTAKSRSSSFRRGRHKSQRPSNCEPAMVPQPAMPWKRAWGGHLGLAHVSGVQIGASGADYRADGCAC